MRSQITEFLNNSGKFKKNLNNGGKFEMNLNKCGKYKDQRFKN
jgi:hypothetical protein